MESLIAEESRWRRTTIVGRGGVMHLMAAVVPRARPSLGLSRTYPCFGPTEWGARSAVEFLSITQTQAGIFDGHGDTGKACLSY